MRRIRTLLVALVLGVVLATDAVTLVTLGLQSRVPASAAAGVTPLPTSLRERLLLGSGIGLVFGVAAAAVLARRLRSPLGTLTEATRRVQSGQYDEPVPAQGAAELAGLAESFNAMQRSLAEREARITHEAVHDALTGLPNRGYAEARLDELLRGEPATPCALILFELRNVREINASLGHHVGDEALREAARRLRRNAGPGDLVARLGANQFLVLAPGCTLERAPAYAEQLVATLRSGFYVATLSLELQVITAVCVSPQHGSTSRELLRRVQIALTDAEEARGRTLIYRPGRDEEQQAQLALAAELRRALEQDALSLVYQPKVTVATHTVRGVEALVRWAHPHRGTLAPGEFVPIAERTGGSRRLASWVLRTAIAQLAAWQREGLDIDMAVNLSAPDILDPQLNDEILGYLREAGVAPERLVLEITESAVMRDAVLAARHMQLLRVSSVRFAIDDFGTGYSSLSQLSRLPVDELKIDRSFMQHAHERRDDATIVRSTIELAHAMGLKVVAEGVEHQAGWDLLRELGCDLAQGFLISRPLEAQDVASFVRA